MVNDFTRKIIQECKKLGIPVTIVKSHLSPKEEVRMKQIEKDVRDYVMKTEEAHKRAAKSKLVFKASVG